MEKLNSVIRVVERCSPEGCWEKCPYYKNSDCQGSLRKDILDLLKDYRRRLGKCHNCAHGSLCVDEDGEYIGCDVKDLDKCNPFGNCPYWEPKE